MVGSNNQLLLIAQDRNDAQSLLEQLRSCGRPISWVSTFGEAQNYLIKGSYAALVLSESQKNADRSNFISLVRKQQPSVATIIMGPLVGANDRIDALQSGADDCIPIPMSNGELQARIDTILRRVTRAATSNNPSQRERTLNYCDLELWTETRLAFTEGRKVDLTRTEFDLLLCLVEGVSEPVDRGTILNDALKLDADPGTSIVAVYIHRLRRKLLEAHSALTVQAIRGKGYALQERVEFFQPSIAKSS